MGGVTRHCCVVHLLLHLLFNLGLLDRQNSCVSVGFSLICNRIPSNVHLDFYQATNARRTCFIPFIKLLFSVFNKEKDDVRVAYVFFSFIRETVNSYNLETAVHVATSFSCFITLCKHTC